MKKYETYKNSGVEWIGEVPENWKTMRFKHFVDLITTPSTHPHKIALENIESKTGKFVSTDSEFEGNGVAFNVDDIVYGKLRPYLQKVWKAEFEGNAIGDFFVYRVKDNCLPSYLKYVMLSDNFTSAANGSTYGAKMPRVASEFIANSVWFLPSLSEQQAIASYLDYKVGQIDASVSAINSQIDDLKSYRQSIISEAVTKGLDPDVPMKDSGVEWIGEIPEGWTIIREKFLMNNYKSGPFGSSLITDKLLERGNILVYTPEHIAKKTTSIENNLYLPEERRNEMSQFFVKPGEIVFPIVGTLGRAMEITKDMPEGIINQRLAKFSINRNRLDVKFFLYLLTDCQLYKDYVYENCRGSIIVNLTKEILSDMPVILPPLFEQQSIVTYLETKVSKIDSAISSLEAQRDDLNTLKQSVISEAVTGKIDVRDWKPNK